MGVDGAAQGYASYGTDGGEYNEHYATLFKADYLSYRSR